MSLPTKGKTFPKMGKVFPEADNRTNRRKAYAGVIAAALKAEVASNRGSLKRIMKWTGVSERAVKVWLAGMNGPRGDHLVALMQNSDRLFQEVLQLSGRRAIIDSDVLLKLKTRLEELAREIDRAVH